MTWAQLLPLIIQFGLPAAESLWKKWRDNKEVTQEDWDELRGLARNSAKDRMLVALKSANVDPASEFGQKMLALAE